MGGLSHRLEVLLVGGVMLLASVVVVVYLFLRPAASSFSHSAPLPVSTARPREQIAGAPTVAGGLAPREGQIPPVVAAATTSSSPLDAGTVGAAPHPSRDRGQGASFLAGAWPAGLGGVLTIGVVVALLAALALLLLRRRASSPNVLAAATGALAGGLASRGPGAAYRVPAPQPAESSSRLGADELRLEPPSAGARQWSVRRIVERAPADSVAQARGDLLKGAVLLIAACGLLAVFLSPLRGGAPGALPYEVGGLLLLCGVVFVLARRGYLNGAGLLLGLGLLPALFYLQPLTTLLTRPLGAALILPVLIVGMVVGADAVRTLGGLVLALVLVLLLRGAGQVWTVDLVMVLAAETGLFWLTLRTLERALVAAQQRASFERRHAELARQQAALERQKVELETRLDQQQQARDFIGHFIHELGGLASGAEGVLDLLAATGQAPALTQGQAAQDGAELVEVLRGNVEETSLLVEDLKILLRQGALSRYQYGALPLQRFMRQVVSLALPPDERLEVALEIPDGLVLYGDERLLRRAFVTALRNAAEAVRRHDELSTGPAIVVYGVQQEGWVLVRIEDSGPGFQPDLLRQMRSLAARPDGTLAIGWFSSKMGGTGRGVPLMEQVARLHQGLIAFGNRTTESGAWVQFKLPSLERISSMAGALGGDNGSAGREAEGDGAG